VPKRRSGYFPNSKPTSTAAALNGSRASPTTFSTGSAYPTPNLCFILSGTRASVRFAAWPGRNCRSSIRARRRLGQVQVRPRSRYAHVARGDREGRLSNSACLLITSPTLVVVAADPPSPSPPPFLADHAPQFSEPAGSTSVADPHFEVGWLLGDLVAHARPWLRPPPRRRTARRPSARSSGRARLPRRRKMKRVPASAWLSRCWAGPRRRPSRRRARRGRWRCRA